MEAEASPEVLIDRYRHAGSFGGMGDCLGLLERFGQRLFAEDRHAGFDQRQDHLATDVRGSAHHRHVDTAVGKHVVHAGVFATKVVGLGRFPHRRGIGIDHRRKGKPVGVQRNPVSMHRGDAAPADQSHAPYLLSHCGAQVTLSDTKTAAQLGETARALTELPIRLCLGATPEDLLEADILFLSPGVPPYAQIVQDARARGVPISSEPRLFTQLCEAPVVGITGSSGKTTTTALTGEMLKADGRNTWVGGNIGVPLTDQLIDNPQPEIVVMELSSFQLELFSPDYQGQNVHAHRSAASQTISIEGWSPPIAAITNITPNHLDRHPSMEDYARAKSIILAHQKPNDWAILNADDAGTAAMVQDAKGRCLTFSLHDKVSQGGFLQGGHLLLRFAGQETRLCAIGEVKLRGRHNLANILAAACCAIAAGAEPAAICQAATTFAGVPHRLEPVRTWHGALFINDSIATSPERAIAALRAYDEPLILLAGGRDKHLPWHQWAECAREKARVIIAFGEAAPLVEKALAEAKAGQTGPAPDLCVVDTMDQAVSQAADLAHPGDIVLLSPGGTSFDAFKDFAARGQRFRDLVAAL